VHADIYDDNYRRNLSQNLVSNFCSNDAFKSYAKRNDSNCKIYVSEITAECMEYIKPILPMITTHDNAMKNISNVKIVNRLFIYCVQAEVYQKVEGINFFE